MVGRPILMLVLMRIITGVPALMMILAMIFLLLQLAPGDTVDALMAQVGGGGDPQMVEALRRQYGLDLGLPAQMANYLLRLVQLDLGVSAIYQKPVATVIGERLLPTLLLMGTSLCLSLSVGTLLGVVAAVRVDRWPDTLISVAGLLFYATPSFWFALVGIVIFSVNLGWLPSSGYQTIASGLGGWERALDIAHHLALPTLALSLVSLATYLRVMRAAMLEVVSLDFVRTARAKGVSRWGVLTRHTMRNAMLPVLTLVGMQASATLGGAVLVESVFALPGLGRLAYESVVQRDLNTLLGIVFISSLVVMAVNLAVDIAYLFLDPRTRGEHAR